MLDQYDAVLCSLEEMSKTASGETATKASGLLDRFSTGKTILGMKIAVKVFGPLEELNRALQTSSYTVSGMLQTVDVIKSQLLAQRTDDLFDELYTAVTAICEQHGLNPISLPRHRRPGPVLHQDTLAVQKHTRVSVHRHIIDLSSSQL